ncbi:MAG: EboA domain-containing protein [Arcicella sp.]|nr:EboA domain-containing protein [Arcicella sp.]
MISEKPIVSILKIIQENVNEKELTWIESKSTKIQFLSLAFVATPRFIGKRILKSEVTDLNGLEIQHWTLDRLVRVYFLLLLEQLSPESSVSQIETLIETAEINESIALFSALPLFSQPEKWLHRAAGAVRSNIGDVFDSFAFGNPFSAKYFSELAWNQLVLKCIFNDKPIHLIQGINRRANQALAEMLSDFAHERWAAGRTVPAQVWRLMVNFMTERILDDMVKLFLSNDIHNKIAATLVCSDSILGNELLLKYPLNSQELILVKGGWKYLENIQS